VSLVSARIALGVLSAEVASVSATFEFTGDGDIAILLPDLPDQQLSDLEFHIGRGPADFVIERRSSAMQALVVASLTPEQRSPRTPPGLTRVSVTYRIRNGPAARFRFALPVPEAAPSGDVRSVELWVVLPDGAEFAGNAFPPLQAVREGWTATLVAVPSLVHVVFGDVGLELRQHRVLEWIAIGGSSLLLLLGWGWSRRLQAGSAEAAE